MTRARRIRNWFWPPRGQRYQGDHTFAYNAKGLLMRLAVGLVIGTICYAGWYNATLADNPRDERGNITVTYSQWCYRLAGGSIDTCYH